jgi:hypothetical protein
MWEVFSMCTAFVSYNQKPIYGWNYDYTPSDIYFSIKKEGNHKCFRLFSISNGLRATSVIFNSYGFIGCMNALPDPKMRYNLEKSDNMFSMPEIWNNVSFLKLADEVRGLFKDKILSYYPVKTDQMPPFSTHFLFADKTGDSFILEYDLDQKFIIPIKGKFQLMTNFANCKEMPVADLPFNGRGRYIYAMNYMDEHKNSFTLEDGLRLLLHTQQYESWKTLISIAFDVEELNIYFSLNRRNDTLFKFNLMDGVIKGLGKAKPDVSMNISDEVFDLKKLEKYYY